MGKMCGLGQSRTDDLSLPRQTFWRPRMERCCWARGFQDFCIPSWAKRLNGSGENQHWASQAWAGKTELWNTEKADGSCRVGPRLQRKETWK